MKNSYFYPLEGIIESEALRAVIGRLRTAVENGHEIQEDERLIKHARADFFRELKKGELLLHETAQRLFFPFMPEGYEVGWVVKARCRNSCSIGSSEKFIPLDTFVSYNDILTRMSDEKRTQKYLQLCPICREPTYPLKSFFIYLPEEPVQIKWVEVRVKESSAKITDKIMSLRPKRGDSIPNNVGEIVQDMFGMRAIVSDYESVRAVMKEARNILGDIQVKNYFLSPKKNGYRAVHMIGSMNSSICELQLRTRESNEAAESGTGSASHNMREKALLEKRLSTPRWQEVNAVVKKVVSPQYEFSLSSE